MIPKNILISGASGLIGSRLTDMLLRKGHHVSHLGRTKRKGSVASFVWDIRKGTIEEEALLNTDCIIHLAGAGVADQRWTKKRKQEILDSRVKSTALLRDSLVRLPNKVTTFIAASAIGYYGFGLSDDPFTEESPPGKDYLAGVVKAWESEVDKLSNPKIRVVKIRVGIVLSEKGGALKEMMQPMRWYAGAPLGSGKQQMSWVHIDDLCNTFVHAIEHESMRGVYNSTGPNAVTNREFTKTLARVMHKPLLLPSVPAFVLKIMLGEMANLVLYGSVVSSEKIQREGFSFEFKTLEEALRDLIAS